MTKKSRVAANNVQRINSGQSDELKLKEVSDGVNTLAPMPQEIIDSVEVNETIDENPTATQLRNLWLTVKQRDSQISAQKERLVSQEKSLKEREESLVSQQKDIESREKVIATEKKELEIQRIAARAGFVEEIKAATSDVATKLDELIGDAVTWGNAAKEKIFLSAIAEQEKLEAARREVEILSEANKKKESELIELEAKIRDSQEYLLQREEFLEDAQRRRIENAELEMKYQIEALQDRLEYEKQHSSRISEELREERNKLASFGNDPDGLQRRIETLTEKVRELQTELSRRPEESEVEELRAKTSRLATAEQDVAYWQSMHTQVDTQLRRLVVSVNELEVVRDERDALASQRETLRQAISLLTEDLEQLQSKDISTQPFPACSAYDVDSSLNLQVSGRDFESLADLVVEVRQRMATSVDTAFFYTERDIRLFLAGLASSRLHILQGISGTGKTSLPREFFKALAGEKSVEIVEVQAGWRDKDDLFGFYNAFEKRFTESEFTKALYRALLPANSDRPMAIVLDEMNLAHPEQYFSVLLSKLENDGVMETRLPLLTSVIPNLPARFIGSDLPLPPNVWFIGTANHDETTVAFADKTYDRAHVQELPAVHQEFSAKRPGKADPVSFSALQEKFQDAFKSYIEYSLQSKLFLRSQLQTDLHELGLGWGNRFERQIDRFIPVVLDAGGTVTEGLDHLISTKLIRKMQGRYGMNPEKLERLADSIELSWTELESNQLPEKSLNSLRAEARKLRNG